MLKTYQNPIFPLVGNVEWIHTPLVFWCSARLPVLRMATVKGEKRNSTNTNKTLRPSSARPSMAPYDHCATRFRVNLNGQRRETERNTPPGMAVANRHFGKLD